MSKLPLPAPKTKVPSSNEQTRVIWPSGTTATLAESPRLAVCPFVHIHREGREPRVFHKAKDQVIKRDPEPRSTAIFNVPVANGKVHFARYTIRQRAFMCSCARNTSCFRGAPGAATVVSRHCPRLDRRGMFDAHTAPSSGMTLWSQLTQR